MRESMWRLLGIPESGKRALLECGRQVYATVRGEYEVQLRWDLERLDEMMGNGEASLSVSLSLSSFLSSLLPWHLSLSLCLAKTGTRLAWVGCHCGVVSSDTKPSLPFSLICSFLPLLFPSVLSLMIGDRIQVAVVTVSLPMTSTGARICVLTLWSRLPLSSKQRSEPTGQGGTSGKISGSKGKS